MATLESIPLFRHLNRAELQALRLITQERRFAAGQEIFREGAPGDGVYFVKSGLVEISAGAENKKVFSRLGEGEFFGEMAVIELRPRSATASAAQETEVFFLPRGEILSFIERSPAFAFALLQQISNRLREFNQLHLREVLEAERLAVVGNFARSIIHDLKNLIAQLSLVVRNADKHHDNPAFMRDAIKTVDHAVGKMNAVMSQLRNSSSVAAAEKFDLRDALQEAVEARKRQAPAPVCDTVRFPVPVRANRQRLASALEHVIHNAQDATGKSGAVAIRLWTGEGRWAWVSVEDNGCGMSEEFIYNRLFKPFETTKGLTGMGIGAYESREFVRSLGGDLGVRSEPGKGSVFVFKIPLAAKDAPAAAARGEGG